MAQAQMSGRPGTGLLGIAGWLVLASAALHILVVLPAGFTGDALRLVPIGLVLILVGLGLMRGMRWLACLAYLGAMAGAIMAYGSMGSSTVPGWWLALIMVTDLLAAATLFLHIWRR